MKKTEAIFDQRTQSGTYSHKVHHGEVKLYTSIINDAPAALGQNLSADKGVSGAKSILSRQLKKSK